MGKARLLPQSAMSWSERSNGVPGMISVVSTIGVAVVVVDGHGHAVGAVNSDNVVSALN
jgi:hypothetical protein